MYIVHLCHNIFFINRTEEHPNFSNFHEYGRNKSRLVSWTTIHSSEIKYRAVSPFPLARTPGMGASEQIDRKFVTLIISFLFSPFAPSLPSPPLLPYSSVPRLLHAREQPGVWPDGILMGHTANPTAVPSSNVEVAARATT